jgi:CheY-like chemotaxis protein
MQDRTILVAEDDVTEVRVLRRAFAKAGCAATVQYVADGEEVMAYLKGEPPYTNRRLFPFPDLLLLDWKMPRMKGYEVLEAVRGHPLLKRLPVIVFSDSDRPRDIALAQEFGANSFLVKPKRQTELVTLVRAIESYWLKWNRTAMIQRPPESRVRK